MDSINYSDAAIVGKRALKLLKDARESLGSARNWGLVDMIGGGLSSGWMKYGNLKDYRKLAGQAEVELQQFGRMLDAANLFDDLDTRIDGFTKFIDLWQDNYLIDFYAQGHIKKAIERLDETISVVERLLGELLYEDTISYFKNSKK